MPRKLLLGCTIGLTCLGAVTAAPVVTPPVAAKLDVSGLGFFRNRELRNDLTLLLNGQRGETLDANAIEDAAVILVAALVQEGYQKPQVGIDAVLADGTRKQLTFDVTLQTSFSRAVVARSVRFHVIPGVRWHLDQVEFSGLTVIPLKIASACFRTSSMLFVFDSTNAYSDEHVANSAGALLELLHDQGYADAKIRTEFKVLNPPGGSILLHVWLDEGPCSLVSGLRFEGQLPPGMILTPEGELVGKVWTPALQQHLQEATRLQYSKNGYADVVVSVAPEAGTAMGGMKPVTVVVKIDPGKVVRLGQVRFEGNVLTREATLRRTERKSLKGLLNRETLERQRDRLSRLGAFDRVTLRFEPAEGELRDAVFVLVESQRFEANLLMGYGSYEQLRGGVELRQGNLFGRAHQSRLLVVQSMKSSSGEYSYSVPELFGETIDGTARVFALQRDEQAFRRQEFGLNLTLSRPLRWLRAEGRLGYTFQALRNQNNALATQATDKQQVNVVSVNLGLAGDHRDNPLKPRKGYRWFGQLELASRAFGGVAEYQRLEVGGAYHTPWGDGRWIHLAMTEGVLTTLGTTDASLPVNKRFYPGGANSIRGYQDGAASPRAADGLFIGAKSTALLSVELEQAVTKNWSVVTFVDALGIATRLSDYPFSERLYSVGLGFRYHTLIGPIRVEYGHNLNPRHLDPTGTLQLSIGAAF